ncbi:MAG TPA: substrate-binding domain-containing protein, partial [Prosthecobacter sp.]|nr:substrate-binding domain-containing protein [Prosthecobacter sp.]
VMRRLALARMLGGDREAGLSLAHAGGSAARQMDQMLDALKKKPAFVIVSPVDAAMLTPLVLEARKNGALVIGIGENARQAPCDTVLWCDPQKLGRLAGEVAVRALKRRAEAESADEARGRVLQIRGDENSARCTGMDAGFQAALKEAPGVVLVHDAPGFWTREGGEARARDALRIQRVVDVIYAHNDLMALGAVEALGGSRDDVLVIGTDGLAGKNGGYTLVNEGVLDATIYQPLLVDFAALIVAKKMQDPAFEPRKEYELVPRSVMPRDLDDIRLKGMMPYPDL